MRAGVRVCACAHVLIILWFGYTNRHTENAKELIILQSTFLRQNCINSLRLLDL